MTMMRMDRVTYSMNFPIAILAGKSGNGSSTISATYQLGGKSDIVEGQYQFFITVAHCKMGLDQLDLAAALFFKEH